ncbi:MAG: MarR family winged helix-turn-helix transcriptional regulator [Candidatus Dormibacteraceae bacterium]
MTIPDPTLLGEELTSTITALRRLVRRKLRPTLPDSPLRGAQVELLRVVEQQPGITVASAARVLHLAANSVSTLVNQLIGRGMLLRNADPDDRRSVQLWLTEAASARLASWHQARIELLAGGIKTLTSADRHALAQALPVLRTLVTILDTGEQP